MQKGWTKFSMIVAGALLSQLALGQAKNTEVAVKPQTPAETIGTAAVSARASGANPWVLVKEEKYDEAKKAFMSAEPSTRWHGLALVAHHQNEKKKSQDYIEKAIAAQPNDPVVLNNAAIIYMEEKPMRPAKLIKDYLSVKTNPLSEDLQNTLGLCLTKADRQTKMLPFYRETLDFYLAYDKRLEVDHPGNRRWGSEWVGRAEADANWKKLREIEAKLDAASKNHRQAVMNRDRQHMRLQDLVGGMRLKTENEIIVARERFEVSVKDEARARRELEQVEQKYVETAKPPFNTPPEMKVLE